jgi:putative effector of murein hydrolase LrgA (UPF0299 family)
MGGLMTLKHRCLIILVALSMIDAVIPVPIIGLVLLYVFLERPSWFEDAVQELYKG